MSHRNAARASRSFVVVLIATVLSVLWAAKTLGAPPPTPPGGPHPLYRGGDNQAGYPPISNVAVDNSPRIARFVVTAMPNPSRGGMRFRATLPSAGTLRVRLFSVDGRRVREWKRSADSGAIEWAWDGRDQQGRQVPDGVYYYSAAIAAQSFSGRLVVLR